MTTKKKPESKNEKTPDRKLKPKHPNTEGAPNDKDPKAQYEDKDES